MMELMLKKAPHAGILRALQTISKIISIIGKEDFIYIEAILCYIGEVSNTNDREEDKEIIDFFAETLSDKRGEIMTTMADRFREQGKLEGKLEEKNSVALHLLSEGFDVDFVSKMTKLLTSEVIKLQKQYEVMEQRKVKH